MTTRGHIHTRLYHAMSKFGVIVVVVVVAVVVLVLVLVLVTGVDDNFLLSFYAAVPAVTVTVVVNCSSHVT